MRNTITIIDYDNDEAEVELPASWCICAACRGNGKSSAYLGAYTAEEFNEAFGTPEERDDYFSGAYDRTCDECNGSGKVLVVDEDRLTPDQRRLWEEDRRIKDELWAEQAAEDRYFAHFERGY